MKRLHGGTCGQPRTSGVSCSSQSLFWPSTVLRRTTFPGALFLGIVAILPWLLELVFPLARNANLLLVSSAGLLIVVGVVRDTFFTIEAELKLHGYDDSLLIR